ncbi:hypothetical protein K458DRAFT_409660 [Lentithecium fluviatile CBS 122367]|uniref:ABM domain-containing protein n=1 Tax=Lentithecium fluviatile CBS 122367 TaxID=1168545 RepID=A0A6G1IHL9_9PLEO|nr:hypothetical protein K458DRAFT_409660 [Lentithecium fluviatile CBS 122367]
MSAVVERVSVLKPKSESLERIKQLFTELANQVIENESGCEAYTVWVQTESPTTPNVVIHERYFNQESFDDHLKTPYFLEVAGAMGSEDLLREPLTLEESAVARLASR